MGVKRSGEGLEPPLGIGTNPFDVLASTKAQGIFDVFGGAEESEFGLSGTSIGLANRFFAAPKPFDFEWEIWGYTTFQGMAYGGIGEVNCGINLDKAGAPSGGMFGWASDYHVSTGGTPVYSQFEATHTVQFHCPFIIEANTQLYFTWVANNLLAGVDSFDLQLFLFWKRRKMAA